MVGIMAVSKSVSMLHLRCRMLSSSSVTFQFSDMNSKLKWGGHGASDPYRKKRTKRKNVRGNSKMERLPLKSEERAVRDLLYPINFQNLDQFISKYVPPEKFARLPIYTLMGLRQRFEGIKESLKNIHGIATVKKRLRKIDPLKPSKFAQWGQEQFIAVNTAIQNKDKATLKSMTTESASETLKNEFQNKVFNWKFIKEIERPRIVSVRVAPLIEKDNLFGQLIVRLHTQQIMAVYDLAGRLVKGHHSRPKNVIDYVVFERSLSATNARWRICGKMPPQIRPNSETINSNVKL
ncbi:PREDICTED: 39S ribosomal protein L45, mitochondrial-like [Amphimedon queenslandica]|uniref:Large ribosomal subunit protein mL45 n=1 Tax=Amphimedon queenslandica TaxID=400682 RepID=A0A1X7UFT2_AMPQE|nr:PREDICTED: 39S ribosomal protein L45, mitochondrial-like [Amphimedon queenslandica]|eukprot:XP_011405308.2 PREDICTED: 39S ribosomal protein L45, mitochondrial-like [Amphimedon queenslandica]